MLATPPFWASSKKALFRASNKPPVELVVADLDIHSEKEYTINSLEISLGISLQNAKNTEGML